MTREYGYDADSNVLYKNNLVFANASELYHPNGSGTGDGYDALNRIVSFTRGTLTASGSTLDTVTTANQDTSLPQHTETWNLDALGNWDGTNAIVTDGTAQSRTHDARNRYTAVGSATPTFDNNGNMTQDELGNKYVYDGWNRLVKIENTSNVVLETYSYDALGRRIVEAPTGSAAKDLYYAANSNVIEERQGSTVTNQYVWGLGYINDLVLRDDNSTSGNYGLTGSGLGLRLFVQQDANWNVTSLADTSGAVQERFVQDPYGRVQVVDKTNWTATTDSYNWLYLFQGGRQDAVSGLVHFNTRDYSTTLGRWGEPDKTYTDSPNLYLADNSNPASRVDPFGTDSVGEPLAPLPRPIRVPPPTNIAPPPPPGVNVPADMVAGGPTTRPTTGPTTTGSLDLDDLLRRLGSDDWKTRRGASEELLRRARTDPSLLGKLRERAKCVPDSDPGKREAQARIKGTDNSIRREQQLRQQLANDQQELADKEAYLQDPEIASDPNNTNGQLARDRIKQLQKEIDALKKSLPPATQPCGC